MHEQSPHRPPHLDRPAYLEECCVFGATLSRLAGMPTAPGYVVDISEAGPQFDCPGALAFTIAGVMDLQLEATLRRLEIFDGRGVACVIFGDRIPEQGEARRQKLLRLTFHEWCHWAEQDIRPLANTPRANFPADLLHKIEPEGVAAFTVADDPNAPPWKSHDAPFIRTACHLWHRAATQGQIDSVGMLSELCAGPRYGLRSALLYLAALGPEVYQLAKMPLPEIHAVPMPTPFVELWARDTTNDEANQ